MGVTGHIEGHVSYVSPKQSLHSFILVQQKLTVM